MWFVFKKQKVSFDLQFIRHFSPPSFNSFEYLSSVGASGVFLFFGNLSLVI
jgi:hypothetical protein